MEVFIAGCRRCALPLLGKDLFESRLLIFSDSILNIVVADRLIDTFSMLLFIEELISYNPNPAPIILARLEFDFLPIEN